jgi:hypothetical protein
VIEIRGRFYRDDDDSDSLPDGAGVHLHLRHPNARSGMIGTEAVDFTRYNFYFELRTGVIPPKSRVPTNDEVTPPGSYYTIEATYPTDGIGHKRTFYENDGHLVLEGAGPIDIGMPPRPSKSVGMTLPERRRMPPATPGVNRHGFFGGTIHCPTNIAESVTSPGNGFAVLAFTLPFSAVVSRVSIMVTDASSGARPLSIRARRV